MKKLVLYGLIALLCLVIANASIFIDKQGVLRNVSDSSLINGTYEMNVTIFNQSSGLAVYSENASVHVSNGTYNYIIGKSIAIIKEIFWSDLYTITKIGSDTFNAVNITYTAKAVYSIISNDTRYLGGYHYTDVIPYTAIEGNKTEIRNDIANNMTQLLTNNSLKAVARYAGSTSSSYDGAMTYSGKSGYNATNSICANEYSNSHQCTQDEILQLYIYNIDAVAEQSNVWIQKGAPGYTADANDCQGFSSNSNTVLGAYWKWSGGYGVMANCATELKVGCCY